ncbi:exopolysaccharide biosynthesis polyprenyl glycosylphosphotransferase [Actinoplanes oblitus]|uniref:Exopolysaccharide biosynthesis polyprenyl glycosylphosphotransferase n=1 Tax=Actinoplanes oblitus TaxID=3040509 RepID=A0ABY8W6U9_9ACTN|nr:exopolysaccharide biosynthesis polyprenyl glycosylphosphotransferase [Actinoplanes oblitus]WIM92881.1 exopolysaccharide biosynthesis polyprenyl glycosylphosphotransferase [Actinoplanes oblitus]
MSRPSTTAHLSLTRTLVLPARVPRLVPIHKAHSGSGESLVLLALDGLAVTAVVWAAQAPWPVAFLPAALAAAGLYRTRLHFSVLDDLPRLVLAIVLTAASIHLIGPSPGPDLAVLGVLLGAVLLARATGYALLHAHRRSSPGRAAIVVGSGELAVRVAGALRRDRSCGLTPVGFVGPRTLAQHDMPVLAPVEELEKAVLRYQPLHLIVAYPAVPDSELVARLRRCRRLGVTVHVVPRLHELAVGSSGADVVRGIPLTRLRPEPMQLRRWGFKRLIDVVGAVVALVLLAPVLLLCALAVKLESGRHAVLFRQERVTRDGEPFTILKFRSLTPGDETESRRRWNIDTDARVGPVGRLLRNSSLDELPQLVNVLTGSMSLVGPRPERPYFANRFGHVYNGYPDRHRVPAGITGWAQIHGLRGDTSITDRLRFDNYYIEHWSLGLDLKIMLRTLGSMLHRPRG